MSTDISIHRAPSRSRGVLRQKKRESKTFVSWMVILLFVGPALSFGQNRPGEEFCDTALITESNNPSAYAGRGNRCEGFYTAKVGGQFEVVSLLIGTLDYPWQEDVELSVSSPHVTATDVNVRAVGLPLGTYYRMDSRLAQHGQLTWLTGDVLTPKRLDAGAVGVFGWVGTERKKVYVPLQVVRADSASDATAPIRLRLRLTVNMDDVFWRYADLDDGECRAWTDREKVLNPRSQASSFDEGELVTIILPSRRTAEECLEIFGREPKSGEWGDLLKIRIRRSDVP